MLKRRERRHLVQGVQTERWMTTIYFVLTDWVGGLCSLAVLTITTKNGLRKSVYTKMSKTEDVLVSQLSSLFYRWASYIFQLTECNKTRFVFADVGPSSIILVGFNFSSSLTNSHFSMKKMFFIKMRRQFYSFTPNHQTSTFRENKKGLAGKACTDPFGQKYLQVWANSLFSENNR